MYFKKFFAITGLVFFLAAITLLCCNSSVQAQKNINVGLIDIEKVMKEWPKYQSYSQQITYEGMAYSILLEKAGPNLEDVERTEMEYQIAQILDHSQSILIEVLTSEMSKAAEKVAKEKDLDMILIKQRVTFGGSDITDEVITFLD